MSDAQKPKQQPSLGRVVHFTPGYPTDQVWTATIAYVRDDGRVNLGGYTREGKPFDAPAIEQAPDGAQAGTPEAAGRWSWPAFVPPKP